MSKGELSRILRIVSCKLSGSGPHGRGTACCKSQMTTRNGSIGVVGNLSHPRQPSELLTTKMAAQCYGFSGERRQVRRSTMCLYMRPLRIVALLRIVDRYPSGLDKISSLLNCRWFNFVLAQDSSKHSRPVHNFDWMHEVFGSRPLVFQNPGPYCMRRNGQKPHHHAKERHAAQSTTCMRSSPCCPQQPQGCGKPVEAMYDGSVDQVRDFPRPPG